jgi:hypothetical protein
MQITEEPNKEMPKLTPVKEVMNILIPGIIDGVPNRNGFIWVLTGSGGSGKTSLLLNFFRTKQLYKGKFSNLYYICPQSSFLSVKKHPFEKHDPSKIYHDLTENVLDEIYSELKDIKVENVEADEEDYQYNCVIIDDMADSLKNAEIQKKLSQMLIKARHLSCAFIFTLQSYHYFPKILRKQITNLTIFKPKNNEEMESIAKEVIHMKKDDGLKLYEYVFNEPYTHLDVDTLTDTLYKNFNKLTIEK